MSPRLRQAVLLALAGLAAAPAFAVDEQSAAPAPVTTAPAAVEPPLVPLPIAPLAQPPATGTPIAPELVPAPATEAAMEPLPPADAAAPLHARPSPAMSTGQDLFTRLRGRLKSNACDAGSNSARWRERYAGHPAAFAQRLENVLPLIDFVSNEVDRAGLPAEFTFIPLVESWYQPGAVGAGGPAGMWQMIPSTAKNHGIHIRDGYDGRLSPVESTRAALSYLHVLQDMFGDWQAIVMAYNAGEGRMQAALRRAGSHVTSAADRRPHGLSNITYDYVDKLQALSCLVSRPERFGLHLPVEARYEPLVPLPLDPGVDSIDAFARTHGQDPNLLRALNPGFRGGRVVAGVPRLVLSPPGAVTAPAAPPLSDEPGTMLAMDAQDEIDVALLLDAALEDVALDGNGEAALDPASMATAIADADVHPPVRALVAEEPVAASAGAAPAAIPVAETTFADAPAPVHQVRAGESLWSIAQSYHLSVAQLRRANRLDDKATVHPGQVLQLAP